MLKPLTIKETGTDREVTLYCVHQDQWPPAHAGLGVPFAELRAKREISETKFQSLQTWERVCGITAMSSDKCPTCSCARVAKGDKMVPYVASPTTAAPPPFARSKPTAGKV